MMHRYTYTYTSKSSATKQRVSNQIGEDLSVCGRNIKINIITHKGNITLGSCYIAKRSTRYGLQLGRFRFVLIFNVTFIHHVPIGAYVEIYT